MVKTALELRERLAENGVDATLVNARFIKPIDTEMIDTLTADDDLFVTLEENVASGGYGEKVTDYLNQYHFAKQVVNVTLPDSYVEHGKVDILKKEVGIDPDSILQKIMAKLGN